MSWDERLTEVDRVRAHTAPQVQAELDHDLEHRLREHVDASDAKITARLDEIDTEWDIERYLEVNASAISAASIAIGILTKRRPVLVLPLAVALFLLQHGLQGWCPPLAIFRRRKVRTRREIDLERYALKAIRGDLNGGKRPEDIDIPELLDAATRR